MTREKARRGRWLSPAEWPDWVLGPPGGWNPVNPAESFERFYRWQEERTAWVRAHRPDLLRVHGGRVSVGPFLIAASEERRRRVREPRVGTFGQPL